MNRLRADRRTLHARVLIRAVLRSISLQALILIQLLFHIDDAFLHKHASFRQQRRLLAVASRRHHRVPVVVVDRHLQVHDVWPLQIGNVREVSLLLLLHYQGLQGCIRRRDGRLLARDAVHLSPLRPQVVVVPQFKGAIDLLQQLFILYYRPAITWWQA